ncbi:hypothetical protein BDY21DRAFT_355408 [Lineolata rhizophorae]|uniref:Uncharacterized protein n=1 Tax=Lineolata rhizophorae TaxID=578093 RepID=A0A6A6NPC0_9PEZI|nr:hypothetical protein BDY21DRAFT_355408 [Lineolata rhizophorae]
MYASVVRTSVLCNLKTFRFVFVLCLGLCLERISARWEETGCWRVGDVSARFRDGEWMGVSRRGMRECGNVSCRILPRLWQILGARNVR